MNRAGLLPAIIVAAALLVAGFLAGGLYQAQGQTGGLFVLNRFTGASWYCTGDSCHPLGGKFNNPG